MTNNTDLYHPDGELVRVLRDAEKWNQQRLWMRGHRDELAKDVQLELFDAGRPMTAAELAPLIGASVDETWATLQYLAQMGRIEINEGRAVICSKN